MAMIVGYKHLTVVLCFFLSRFSFADTDNSYQSRGSKGTIFILRYHVHQLPNIQKITCSFASDMITFLFPTVVHVTTILLLDSITSLLEIRIWLNVNFILLACLFQFDICSFPQTRGALEFAFILIILLQQTKWLTKWNRDSYVTHILVKDKSKSK